MCLTCEGNAFVSGSCLFRLACQAAAREFGHSSTAPARPNNKRRDTQAHRPRAVYLESSSSSFGRRGSVADLPNSPAAAWHANLKKQHPRNLIPYVSDRLAVALVPSIPMGLVFVHHRTPVPVCPGPGAPQCLNTLVSPQCFTVLPGPSGPFKNKSPWLKINPVIPAPLQARPFRS
jgi:hypothetical protein